VFKKVYIYTLSCPIRNEIMYIGKTINLKERLIAHYKEKKCNKSKIEWVVNLREKGLKPIMEVLDEVYEHNWSISEKYWISQFKSWGFNLLNISEGGEGINLVGFKHTKESKIKISNAGKGRKHSEETKRLMSVSGKGKIFSEEHVNNLSLSHKGQVHESLFKPVVQIDCNNGLIINNFKSIRDAELHTGICNEVISKCCKGKCKRAGGYYWCYELGFNKFSFTPFKKSICAPKSSKKILQINSLSNEVINEFDSISKASIYLGKGKNGRSNITKSIEKGKTAYGFKWIIK
jgi:group I intron endonuclease